MKQKKVSQTKNKCWISASNLLVDFLKDTLWGLLTVVINKYLMSLFGVTLITGLVLALIYLWKWLITPITISAMPAYVATVIIAIIFGIKIFQQIRFRSKRKRVLYMGLAWKILEEGNSITGPFCPKCKNGKINISFNQISNATNKIFGQESKYIFTCTCGHQLTLNKSPTTIKEELLENMR